MSLILSHSHGTKPPQLSEPEKAAIVQALSTTVSRQALASRLGKSFSGDRNLYKALGWPITLEFSDYQNRLSRDGISARVVNAPPDMTWRKHPDVQENQDKETAFETALADVVRQRKLFAYMKRADRLAGIGQYGVLLLGFNDGKPLSLPVERASELLYLMPYTEGNATIRTWDSDTSSARYGLPETYSVTMRSNVSGKTSINNTGVVHWSRLVHIAENPQENDVLGTPRMKDVFNYLLALEMVAGGSAEMFWRGAFPGFAVIADADADMTQSAAQARTEIESYVHQMQRFMRLQGMKVENLGTQVADPSSHVSVLLDLIAGSKGIPKRILIGSERGELASTQDESAWAAVIEERRTGFAEPQILRPVIDRLVSVGVLPEPESGPGGYSVTWPDLIDEAGKDKAEKAERLSRAIAAYANVNADSGMVVPLPVYLRKVLGFTREEIAEVEQYLGQAVDEAIGDGSEVPEE